MRPDREIAFRLRLSGKSYSQIYRELGIPKSTLAGWFSGLVLSKKITEKIYSRGRKKAIEILLKRNHAQTAIAQNRALEIRRKAAQEIFSFSDRDLFILGVALYWAEGYKRPVVRNGKQVTSHAVSLTNSDPILVAAFIKFLRKICNIEQKEIKAGLRIFEHQNEKEIKEFWSKECSIPLKNFMKTYRGLSSASQRKRPFNQLPHGVIQIAVATTQLFHRLMGYIEGIKKVS